MENMNMIYQFVLHEELDEATGMDCYGNEM